MNKLLKFDPADFLGNAKRILLMFLGSMFYAVGLKFFLLPNGLFDNGTTGICVIIYYLTGFPLGILFILLNIPFWIIGYKFINKNYAFLTIFSIITLSGFVEIFKILSFVNLQSITNDIFLASIFGGVLLGFGVGIIIRNGGAIDGVETIAIIYNRRTGFSIGEIALFFNIFIIGSAGFIFGLNRALYSLISYFICIKMIDLTVEGFDDAKSVMIISDKAEQISMLLMLDLGKGVTFLTGKGGFTKSEKNVIYTVITRFEIGRLKKLVNIIDPNSFVIISDVHEVMGGNLKRKKKK
jgi:uncharacterized membrane-anchored protein YitT (DUF2179 family)